MFPIRDTIPSERTPLVTYFIIALNLLVFFYQATLPDQGFQRLIYSYGMVPLSLASPEWAVGHGLPGFSVLPLLTSQFLHGGWLHIIANMWTLYIFGDNVEDVMGHFGFLAFYLLAGAAAIGTHVIFNASSPVPVIGASGAIAGVMGAYLIRFPNARVLTLIPIFIIPYFIELPAFIYLIFWFVSQLVAGTASLSGGGGGIAWWAHIGGFVVGIGLLPLFARRPRSARS